MPETNTDPIPRQNRIDLDGVGFQGVQSTYAAEGGSEQIDEAFSRYVRDQINASRTRFNRLGKTTGATEQQLTQAQQPLRGQLGRLDSASGKLSGLTGELTSSALGSTAGGAVSAANAARLSGDGRFGGGGNAARVAARGATDAAVGQSAALSQALVQGRLGEANYESGLLQQRGGVSAALSQLLQGQAGLREERGRLGVANENEAGRILAGVFDVYGGIRQARIGKASSRETSYIDIGNTVVSQTGSNTGGVL